MLPHEIKKELVQLIKSDSNIYKNVLLLLDNKINELKVKIEKEKKEVELWYNSNWKSDNLYKKELEMKKSFIIKPGYTEFILESYYKLKKRLYIPKNNIASSGSVTEEEIQRAKLVPIDSIIEFNKSNKTYCLWHDEKTESMSYHKNNYVKCFGCGKYSDSIGVYMKTHNLSFVNAVKELNKL